MPIYLKIDGVTGDSTDANFVGWFEIDSFDFGVTRPISSTGQATGPSVFSPLTVDLHSLQGLAPLLVDLAANKAIKNVELVETTGGEDPQTVYDLKLTNASIIDYTSAGGPSGIETGIKIDYQKVSLTDHGVTVDGGPSLTQTATARVQRFDASAGSFGGAETSEVSTHLFLTIDGIKLDLDAFDFTVTRPVDGSGRATGTAAFSPLTVDFNSLTGLAPLFADLTSNKRFSSVELTETTGGEDPQTVYDLKLSNASLIDYSNFTGANGIETELKLDFQKAVLTDHGVTTEGELGKAETADVKVGRMTAGAAGQTSLSHIGGSFFLKIDGITGDSTDSKHAGWFEVDAFNFGVTSPVNGTGLTTGRAQFSPLTVDIDSLGGLAPLLADLASHKNIPTVELVETTGGEDPQTIYDLKLSNARLVDYANASTVNGIETGLKIDFQKVTLTDHGVTTEGDLGAPETASAKAQSFTAGTVGFGDATELGETPFRFFIKIDGVTGDSTDSRHAGWFDVDTFKFGASQPVSGTGAATGVVNFTPLTVDIHSLAGLSALLADLTQNKQISKVELVETDADFGDAPTTVYDLKLSNAVLADYSNASGADGIETSLKFDFRNVSLTDRGVTTEGGLAPAETTAVKVQRLADTDTGFSDLPAVPVIDPLRLFLKIDGVSGDSTDDKHKGWFEVDSFNFGATRPVGSTGLSSGRAAFSPLTLDLNSLTGLAPLLADLSENKRIPTVELAATTAGEEPQTVYDLKLSNAVLTDYYNAPGSDGIETGLKIDFQKASLTDRGVTTDGTEGGPTTTDVTASSFTPDTTSFGEGPVPVESPFQLFLKVDSVTGDSTDDKHKGWFDVDSFNFNVSRPTNASGLPTGRAEFSPLTVDIHALEGLAPLLADQTSSKNITSVELVETDDGQTVYDLKLTNALLAMVQNAGNFTGGVDTSLSFTFQRGTLTDHAITTEGSLGSAESAGFNVARNLKV